jgi:transposase
LATFAHAVGASPTKQVVLVLDRAGWHTSARLRVPEHVHLLFLPTYSPELQPAEHLWSLTNTVLVNRHFASIDEFEDAQAERCAALQARRELIRSATLFYWWRKPHHETTRATEQMRSLRQRRERQGEGPGRLGLLPPQAPDVLTGLIRLEVLPAQLRDAHPQLARVRIERR